MHGCSCTRSLRLQAFGRSFGFFTILDSFAGLVLASLISLSLYTTSSLAADNEFERWKQGEQEAFSKFQTAEDRAFVAFLETEWQTFQRFKRVSRDQEPKPALPPRISNSFSTTTGTRPGNSAVPVKPADFDDTFFAHEVQDLKLPAIKWPDLSHPDGDALAAIWSELSAADHSNALQSLGTQAKELALGDWGILQLCKYLLQEQNANRQNAHCWFLLNRMGYDLRIGYEGQTLALLLPTSIPVYDNNFIRLGNRSFYILGESSSDTPVEGTREIRAYERSSSQSLRDFDLKLEKVMRASGATRSFVVQAPEGSSVAGVAVDFDAGRSAMLATHPQVDLKWYFSVPPGAPTAGSLAAALKPRLNALSEREAINFLLHFVQNSFSYQTDQEQFGRERYLLAEESLNYGINDCEDRSILLAWLLHDLLSLDVAVLDYPGHVALAVRTSLTKGDALVIHGGRKYVVLDPTYIGANAGMVMPEVAALSPETFLAEYTLHPL